MSDRRKDERPDPVAMIDAIRQLVALNDRIERIDAARQALRTTGDKVDRSDGTEHPAPGDFHIIAYRADVYNAAHAYAHMLVEDRSAKVPASPTSGELLGVIVKAVGYFTGHEYLNIAWAFHDDIDHLIGRATAILEPSDEHKTPIGPCLEPECKGEYKVTWVEGDGTDERRTWQMANTRRDAHCTRNRTHVIDPMLYARTS